MWYNNYIRKQTKNIYYWRYKMYITEVFDYEKAVEVLLYIIEQADKKREENN